MKKLLLLTTCLLSALIAADMGALVGPCNRLKESDRAGTELSTTAATAYLTHPQSWHPETVDEQIKAWEVIHATKRGITNFSHKDTHFPEIFDRIIYSI